MAKVCDIWFKKDQKDRCYYTLQGCYNNDEFDVITKYKSWMFKSWKTGKEEKVFCFIEDYSRRIFWSYIGFAPIIIRLLQQRDYIINEDEPNEKRYVMSYLINGKENFNSKDIIIGSMFFKLWDFQEEAVKSWIDNGCCGIIKSPTGSGKSIVACDIIKKMNVRTLISVHTSDLMINVWFNNIVEQFSEGIKGRIGLVGGGLSKNDRLNMRLDGNCSFEYNIGKDIVITTAQSVLNKLDRLSEERFGLVIFDECLPYSTLINTTKGCYKIGELYDSYSDENKRYLVERMEVNCINLETMNVIESKFIPKKTAIKRMYEIKTETGISFVSSYDHKYITDKDKNGNIDYSEIYKCKNIGYSLIRSYDNRDECIRARLFGYILGDGNLNSKNYRAEVYGSYEDMLRMEKDINKIGFTISDLKDMKDVKSIITTEDGEELEVCGDVCIIGLSSEFGHYLSSIGYPFGKKTNKIYDIPNWIMEGSVDIKREFLAGFMGAEVMRPRERLKRSFEAIRFNYYKREDLVEDSMSFANQLTKLFSEFDIAISKVEVLEGNIRKDGTTSKEIRFTISNSKESMVNLLNIGYRYCKEREVYAEIIRQYYLYTNKITDKTIKTSDFVIELYKSGYAQRNIINMINSINNKKNSVSLMNFFTDEKKDKYELDEVEYIDIDKSMIDHWRANWKTNEFSNGYSKNNVVEFKDWLKKVNGNIIFLDVTSRKFVKEEQGYDLEILNENHNYIVNTGINVHNCHHYSAENFRKVANAVRAPYKLGLSATLNRPDGTYPMFEGMLGGRCFDISIKKLVDKGVLVQPIFETMVVNDHPIQMEIATCGLKQLELSRYIKKLSSSSVVKKDYILDLVKGLTLNNKKFIMYTDWVTPVDGVFTRDDYVKYLQDMDVRVVGVSSELSGKQREQLFDALKKGKLDGLVFGSLGSEGVNIPAVDSVVMCNATASTIRYPQRVGRAMRSLRDNSKRYAFIYEILLDTPKEHEWAAKNFYEYKTEGYRKKKILIDNGKVISVE